MSDKSQQDRTEDPTPRRLKEAREEGQVPKTQELSSAAILVGAGLLLGPGASLFATTFGQIAEASLTAGPSALSAPGAAVDWLRWTALQAAWTFLPFGGSLALIALAVGAVQGRATLTVKPLKPDLKRMSPLERLKRYVGPQPWVDLLKSVFKVTVVGLVVYVSLAGATGKLSRLAQSGPRDLTDVLRSEVMRVLVAAGMALFVLALFDHFFQSWQHARKLRMTREEVRRDNKDSEGDPLIRARLRTLGRSLARMRMMKDVPTADVVVTNPTHIAVALRYDPEKADAPVVVAMGRRKLAERIKRIALDSGVPVVENRPVARALLGLGRVGEPIPQALYVAVAEILAFVFRHRRARTAAGEATA